MGRVSKLIFSAALVALSGCASKQKVWPVVTPRLEVLLKEAKEKDTRDFGDEGIEQRTICRAKKGGDYRGKHPSRVFCKIARAAGIPDEVQFRDLRRTLAQEMAHNNATSQELMSQFGWGTIS